MSMFKRMKSRQIQNRANNFIKSLEGKSEKEVEQAYLDNKEFENNEIVLSYLFFKFPSLIRILPIEFQKSRLNSNLSMFRNGSQAARRELVSDWLRDNKFFMNAIAVDFDEDEYESYMRLYFTQPKDVAKLYMDDLRKAITILSKSDIKQTEMLIDKIKDELNDRQWEFVVEVEPMLIKYAPSSVQNKYSDDERFTMFISGEARQKWIVSQVDKVKNDINLLKEVPVEVQKEYITMYPYMINYIDDNILIELLKYDISLIKYVNIPSLIKPDGSLEVIYGILDNIENKSIQDLVSVFVDKSVLPAKGKLYRFDDKSNNLSYQYTKRIIRMIQELSVNQMMVLIRIDVNYVLPYVVPVYNSDTDRHDKESLIIEANSRCLNLFRNIFGDAVYTSYYKVINKIYNEFLANIDKYDYNIDYNSVFDLFKVLFNRRIITRNNVEKVTIFVGVSLLYKDREDSRGTSVKLLNELLERAYDTKINNESDLYELGSLEIFDPRFDFIPRKLLLDFANSNFDNVSTLLFIVKSDRSCELFKKYYEIFISIYGEDSYSLYKCVENYCCYRDLFNNIKDKSLTDDELTSLIEIVAHYGNYCNIDTLSELRNYSVLSLKQLITWLSAVNDEDIYKNLLCNYLFNRGYNSKGNTGWLELTTISEFCDIFDVDDLRMYNENEKVFTDDEISLFSMMKLMFSVKDFELMFSFIENIINNKVRKNIIAMCDFFNKLDKYKFDIVNAFVVDLNDIEELYQEGNGTVDKKVQNDVIIYNVIDQDFKVISAYVDNGTTYNFYNVSDLDRNAYGYNSFVNDGAIRLSTEDNRTVIKVSKDKKNKVIIKPTFIIVPGSVNDDLIDIARRNNLAIVHIHNS